MGNVLDHESAGVTADAEVIEDDLKWLAVSDDKKSGEEPACRESCLVDGCNASAQRLDSRRCV